MKNTPDQSVSLLRGSPWWAAGLFAAGFTVSMASAQPSATGSNGSGGATSDRTATSSSTSPNSDRGAMGMPSPGNANGSGTNGSNYGGPGRAHVAPDSRDYNGSASTLKRADKRFITKAVECSERELAASQLAAQRATNPQIRSFAQQVTSEHQRMQQELVQLAERKGVQLDHMENRGTNGSNNLGGQSNASVGMRGTTEPGIAAASDTANLSGVANDHGSPRAGAVGATEGTATNSNINGAISEQNSDRHVRNLSRQTGPEFDREYVDLIVDSHEDAVKLYQKAAKDAQDSDVRAYASSHVADLQAHLDQANLLMKSAAE